MIYTICDDNACLLLSDYVGLGGEFIPLPFWIWTNEWMNECHYKSALCSLVVQCWIRCIPPTGAILLFSLITTINVWMGSTCSSRFVVAERNETIYRQQLTTIPRFLSESPQRAPVRWLSQRTTLATTKTTSPIWPTAFGAQSGLSMLMMMMTIRVELPAYSSCEMSHDSIRWHLTWLEMWCLARDWPPPPPTPRSAGTDRRESVYKPKTPLCPVQ